MKAMIVGLFALLCLGSASAETPSTSSEPKSELNVQQSKMVTCNARASGKTGDERAAFMKSCLSASSVSNMSRQEKMTFCNQQAAGKKGAERRGFMESCLATSPAAGQTTMSQQDKMTNCNQEASGKKGDERKGFMEYCLSTVN